MEESKEPTNFEEVIKDSTLMNPDLTFCEKTTYLDFLLSNAKDEEERKQIQELIDNFLEISKDEDSENQ